MAETYYEILGIDRKVSKADLRDAFLHAAFEHYPRDGHSPKRFILACEAFAVLSDPKSRFVYDGQLKRKEVIRVEMPLESAEVVFRNVFANAILEWVMLGYSADDIRKFAMNAKCPEQLVDEVGSQTITAIQEYLAIRKRRRFFRIACIFVFAVSVTIMCSVYQTRTGMALGQLAPVIFFMVIIPLLIWDAIGAPLPMRSPGERPFRDESLNNPRQGIRHSQR